MILNTLVLAASAALTAATHGDCGSMPVGYHEFALFGTRSAYIAHYPLFSSIHAYQIVAEVELGADNHDALAQFAAHQAAHPGTKYTLSPYRKVPIAPDRAKDQEDWVLPAVVRDGAHFNADITYREAGVTYTLDANLDVKVKRVIVSQLLDPKAARPASLSYVLFGVDGEAFLTHVLSAPPNPGSEVPDFDQVLAVDAPGAKGGVYHVAGRDNVHDARLKLGDVAVLDDGAGATVRATVQRELFDRNVGTER